MKKKSSPEVQKPSVRRALSIQIVQNVKLDFPVLFNQLFGPQMLILSNLNLPVAFRLLVKDRGSAKSRKKTRKNFHFSEKSDFHGTPKNLNSIREVR